MTKSANFGKRHDQLLNIFYCFHLALHHLANYPYYSYVIIYIQLGFSVSQKSKLSSVSAGLATPIFRLDWELSLETQNLFSSSQCCTFFNVKTLLQEWTSMEGFHKCTHRESDRSFVQKKWGTDIYDPTPKI